jgi:hypothetical protein
VSAVKQSRWGFAPAAIAMLVIVLPVLVRDRAFFAQVWTVSTPLLVGVLALIAAAILLAAAFAGVKAWRQARA